MYTEYEPAPGGGFRVAAPEPVEPKGVELEFEPPLAPEPAHAEIADVLNEPWLQDEELQAMERPPAVEPEVPEREQPATSVHIDALGVFLAEPSGTVNIQRRVLDQLESHLVDREAIRSDVSYCEAPEWTAAELRMEQILHTSALMLVVAPRGSGATTFCKRQLALHTPRDVEIKVTEVDWNRPTIGKLPTGKKRAYLLDLQDQECDRIEQPFLTGLQKYGEDLAEIGSFLVMTITPELWADLTGYRLGTLEVVRLTGLPDAVAVLRQHLRARQQDRLIRYTEGAAIQEALQTALPVRAVRLATELIELADRLRQRALEEGLDEGTVTARTEAEFRQLAIGWEAELDQRFGDPLPSGSAIGQKVAAVPFKPEERYLAMALALRGSAPASQVQGDADRLAAAIGGESEEGRGTKRSPDLRQVFARAGLRSQLAAIGARVELTGRAEFTSPGYGEAMLPHVWGQYDDRIRKCLIRWMVSCVGTRGEAADDPVVRTMIRLIASFQDASKLQDVQERGMAVGRPDVVVAVMVAAARDESLRKRARRLLYDWATTADNKLLVVDVCRELVKDQPGPALTRLRRVADSGNAEVLTKVLEVFQEIAEDPELTDWLARAAQSWPRQADGAATPSANLATLALLGVVRDGAPWASAESRSDTELAKALRDLLADFERYPKVAQTIRRWVLQSPRGEVRDRALNALRAAFRGHSGLNALFALLMMLGDIRDPDGGSPADRLRAAVIEDEPELASLISPLEVSADEVPVSP
ncbi:hypothetical protein [Kitasatospora sp. NBC_01302]|uniref:hypothetical protein n=1 Tax=Kitasatospora sp. NBC_01302 TaxID=2903575 RepID=UPI002E0E1A51|nr:hypothetical protein OG294_36870 [Kitasatospora sp. NBC_01302]